MRRSPSPRRTLAAISASVLVLALAGCGSGDSGSDEPDSASSSSAAGESPTADGGSTDAVEGEEVDASEFAERLRAAMEDVTTVQVTMTMDTSGMAVQAEGSMDYSTDPTSMAISMEMPALGDQPIDMRMVDGFVYMNMGPLSQGKFWKLDPDDEGSPLGDLGSLTDSMDPAKSFDDVADGFKKVVYVGAEEVDGETLHHYSVTLDSAKLKGAAGGSSSGTLAYDLWLDDQDRTRRTVMDMGDLGTVDATMFGYGEPVDIEAPPADQVAQMPSMMGGA